MFNSVRHVTAILLSVIFLAASSSNASNHCKTGFDFKSSSEQKFQKVFKFTEDEAPRVKEAIKPFGFEYNANQRTLVKEALDKVKDRPGTALEKANIIAELGKVLKDIYKTRPLAERTLAEFNISEAVAELESFKPEEFQAADIHPVNNSTYTLVSLKEYPEFAMALAKRIAPPKRHGSGGVLSIGQYRDIVANNLWLYTLETHDLKHIHFANSHPMATANFFRSARSKNHLRFVLMAALYEAVDTVQYSHEVAISALFRNQGRYLEDAMVYLGAATQSELNSIASAIGISENSSFLSSLKSWVPSYPKKPLENSVPHDKLEKDIDDMIETSNKHLADPKINKYMKPELIPDGEEQPAGTSSKPGERLH